MMSQIDLPKNRPSKRRREGRRGQEVIEFGLCAILLFAMIFVYLDIAWGVFEKATLEQACRIGVRYGITNVVPDPNMPGLCSAGDTLTHCVQEHVQWAAGAAQGASYPLSGGLLDASVLTGTTSISVSYFMPTTAGLPPATGILDSSGNVMVVSVNNFPIYTLLPPIVAPPSVSKITVSSADTLSGQSTLPSP